MQPIAARRGVRDRSHASADDGCSGGLNPASCKRAHCVLGPGMQAEKHAYRSGLCGRGANSGRGSSSSGGSRGTGRQGRIKLRWIGCMRQCSTVGVRHALQGQYGGAPGKGRGGGLACTPPPLAHRGWAPAPQPSSHAPAWHGTKHPARQHAPLPCTCQPRWRPLTLHQDRARARAAAEHGVQCLHKPACMCMLLWRANR